MELRISSTALAIAALCAGAGAASANLIVNGGFETGDFTGWINNSGDTGADLFLIDQGYNSVWSVYFGSYGESVTGNFIGQHVGGLISGATYSIRMWVWNGGVGGDSLTINWDGQILFDQSPLGLPLEEWSEIKVTGEFNSEGDSALLLISGQDNKSSYLIDDISVTLVPTPGAAALLGTGALAATRRRRG